MLQKELSIVLVLEQIYHIVVLGRMGKILLCHIGEVNVRKRSHRCLEAKGHV